MKPLFCIFLMMLSALLPSQTAIQQSDCKCKNVELKGRVKTVTSGADFRIKVVESLPDLRVKKVARSPLECGEWQFVDAGEDFTVQFVETFPDFTIKYVEVLPGMN
jgi:hypothetical protein